MLHTAPMTFLAALLGCTRPAPAPLDGGLVTVPKPNASLGAVDGRAVWVGARPVLPPLSTNASVESVCGRSVADPSLRVGPEGGLADVVVWAEGPPAPAEQGLAPAEVLLDQRTCLYLPPVLAARAGASVRLRNSDPLTHTVHGVAGGQTVFNVAMPLERMELVRQLPARPGVIEIRCDVHPWMRATVRTFDHARFTTTDAAGRFRLSALPLGEAEVHAWHPRLGERVTKVQVGEGGEQLRFDFGGER